MQNPRLDDQATGPLYEGGGLALAIFWALLAAGMIVGMLLCGHWPIVVGAALGIGWAAHRNPPRRRRVRT